MNRVDVAWADRSPDDRRPRAALGAAPHLRRRARAEGRRRASWRSTTSRGSIRPRSEPRSPRTIYFMAKIEAHRVPGLGQLIRAFGTFSVRRGESDREAVRIMREIVRDGSRARALRRGDAAAKRRARRRRSPARRWSPSRRTSRSCPRRSTASQHWKIGNFHPVSIAWGEPMRFEGLPKGGKGYREASAAIQEEIHRLWRWLVELHEAGKRPAVATPP